jgi:integrase
VVKPYLEHYGLKHRPKSVIFSRQPLAHVVRLPGNVLLPDLTDDTIRGYVKRRLEEGTSERTINMELGELSRAVGKTWCELWPKVRKLEERKDVGRALSSGEERRLLDAGLKPRRGLIGTFVRIALLTGMRAGEIIELIWSQIDFQNCVVTVGRAKTSSGTGRQIPMNAQLFQVLAAHRDWFVKRFGETRPEYFLFPFGKTSPTDPTRPITDLKRLGLTSERRKGQLPPA